MDGTIIVGARQVPLQGVTAKTYVETGLEFRPPLGCSGRQFKVDSIVVHDTGASNPPDRVFANLHARKLSCHFIIGEDGVVWQFADPLKVTCAHAGSWNGRSVGIEVVNRVTAPLGTLHAMSWKLGRPIVRETYRTKTRTVLGHTPAQKAALSELVLALIAAIPTIPPHLPWLGDGTKVAAVRISDAYSGVLGHLNCTDAHVDPVGDIYEVLSPKLRVMAFPPTPLEAA